MSICQTTKEKKEDEMNIFHFVMFDPRNFSQDICRTILVTLEVKFHHEGGLSLSHYFQIFILSPHQKSGHCFTLKKYLLAPKWQ